MTTVQKRTLIVILILGGLIALYYIDPMSWHWTPRCLIKLLTGYSCAGCGSQRAMYALMHGHWGQAIRFNYFLLYAAPYSIALVVERYFMYGKWQQCAQRCLEHPWAIFLYIIIVFLWSVIRNMLCI